MSLIRDLVFRMGVDDASWSNFFATLDSGKAKLTDFGTTATAAGAQFDAAFSNFGTASTALEDAGSQFQAFGSTATSALEEVNQQLNLFDTGTIEEVDSALGSLTGTAEQLAPAMTEVGSSAGEASGGLHEAGAAAEEAETGFSAAAEQLVLMGEAFAVTEGLKEFGTEMLTAYGTVQSVTIGLTQLTGSATDAKEIIEEVEQVAKTEPFAFPELAPTVQRMVALGVSTEQIPGVMQAAADAAAATGHSFDEEASAIDRMALSGNAGARQMVALGLSAKDLGAAMDVSAGEVKKAFAEMDQEERLQALTDALQKFAGSAEAQAQGIAGQWQIAKNEFEEIMVAIGAAVAPVAQEFLTVFRDDIVPAIQTVITWFKELPGPVQDAVVVLGLAAAAVPPLVLAIGTLGLGIAGIQAALPAFTGMIQALGLASAEAAGEEGVGAATTAVRELGTVAEVAAGGEGIAAATTAVKELGTAAEVTAGASALGGIKSILAGISEAAGPVALALGVGAGLAGIFTVLEAEAEKSRKSTQDYKDEVAQLSAILPDAQQHMLGYGTAIDQTAKALLDYANAHSRIATVEGNTAAATQAVIDKQTALDLKYEEAVAVLKNIEENFQGAADYAEIHARAVADVDAAWKAATPSANAHAKAVHDLGLEYATVPSLAQVVAQRITDIEGAQARANSEFQITLQVYAQLKASGTATVEELARAHEDMVAAATKAKVSEDDWAAAVRNAIGFTQTGVIVNGQYKQTLLDAADAAEKAGTEVKVLNEQWDEETGILTTTDATVNVLTGSVNQNAGAAKTDGDAWVYLNGAWEKASELGKEVQSTMQGVTQATADAAQAASAAAQAFGDLGKAMGTASSEGQSFDASSNGQKVDQQAFSVMAQTALGEAFGSWNSPFITVWNNGLDATLGAQTQGVGIQGGMSAGVFPGASAFGGNDVPTNFHPLDQQAAAATSTAASFDVAKKAVDELALGSRASIPALSDSLTKGTTAVDQLSSTSSDAAHTIEKSFNDLNDAGASLLDTINQFGRFGNTGGTAYNPQAALSGGAQYSSNGTTLSLAALQALFAAQGLQYNPDGSVTQLPTASTAATGTAASSSAPYNPATSPSSGFWDPVTGQWIVPNGQGPGAGPASLNFTGAPAASSAPYNAATAPSSGFWDPITGKWIVPGGASSSAGAGAFAITGGWGAYPAPASSQVPFGQIQGVTGVQTPGSGGVYADFRGASITSLQAAQQLVSMFVNGIRNQARLNL